MCKLLLQQNLLALQSNSVKVSIFYKKKNMNMFGLAYIYLISEHAIGLGLRIYEAVFFFINT